MENNRRGSRNNQPDPQEVERNVWRTGFRTGLENGISGGSSTHFNDRRRDNRPRPFNQRRGNSRFFDANARPNRRESSRSMGFVFLQNLEKNDSEKIILTLMKERDGFLDLLKTELSCDVVVLIVKVLRKVCSSSFHTKYKILHPSLNETFVNKLRTFIACLPTQDMFQRNTSGHFWKDPNEFFNNLIEICQDLLNTTPTFAYKTIPAVLNAMKVYIPPIEAEQKITVSDVTKTKVETMLRVIETAVKENEEKQKIAQPEKSDENTEPPDDFHKISVYPSPEEIVGGRGFLRENVVEGPYQSVHHYLDVQFRLLREDFVGPLRDGIANYRSSTPTHLENVRVHKGVQFLNTETINEYYCLRVQFGSKKKKLANFENSKRFMFGSLVCFTKDNFQTLIFGKVARRDLKDLEQGQIIVAFDEKEDVEYKRNYLMVECSVYFEPYYHVLTVLKDMTEENFPMERYIIRVNPSVQPPEYLTDADCMYDVETHTFNPLSEWPNEHFYNFNDSQLVAFKAAITQEIVVIQGPPGTGKTYLGLKVAQTLLTNKECWYHQTPMLVICFTNHALDQFLEGLIPFTRRIIRVGGQSKNTNLDMYNLRYKIERDGAVAAQKRRVQECLRQIKHMTEDLEQIGFYNSVLSFHKFEEVIPNFSDSWFSKARKEDIIHWLLQGAYYGQDLWNVQNNLNVMQAQDEFNRIGINDDVEQPAQTIHDTESDFNDHIISKFDTIFEEVLGPSAKYSNQYSFLITLNSIREQVRQLEGILRDFNNPNYNDYISLQDQMRREEINLQVTELKYKYEYLKRQLDEGRRLGGAMEMPENVDLDNPYNMYFEDRWRLYFYWLNLYKIREADILRMTCEDFPDVYKQYEDMREIEDVNAMKDALVVGMTTTSAARLRKSLQTLKSPIVIVEEAAEVLEAHIVTSITKHCKHLILIGDHKQLKPNTANYTMERKFRLGISLFERMIINNIHCYTLNVQHRMRPEISCLIRPTIYDFLQDHPSVHQRPPIDGIDNCVYFIDHEHPEEACEGSSKTNQHEVTFLIHLARHLVLNGYNPENITILAAYLGQFFAFKIEIKAHQDLLKGIRVAVLDNFQGEESDIILLSLVRNNNENKIGFLAIENRVCVALSRARNGLYIMGNMTQLSCDNKLWRKIKASLENQKALGPKLPLRCKIHQDQVTLVESEIDFSSVAEGGCNKKCEMDLVCGHKCTYLCHVRDRNHMYYKCQTQCQKPLCKKDEAHICKKLCYEDCGPCNYIVQRTLSCGHEVGIPCHVDPATYKCDVKVDAILPCGHKATKQCHENPETFQCQHICEVQVQPCGHACELLCHIRKDPDHVQYLCRKPCARYMKDCTTNEEDHRCKKLCHQECDRCTIKVRKHRTVCSHVYDVPCWADVDELNCEKPCKRLLTCGHPCKGKCNEPCQDCQSRLYKTHPICKHPINTKCSEPPDRNLCTKKCPLKLPCGHLCTKKCNEPCTTICTVPVDCSGIEAACGHLVTTAECHMATSYVDPKLLIQYCKEPCGKMLKCGHICSGSCGECSQGRIHKRCSEKCGAPLVCDHPCGFSCRQACRPCNRVCNYSCGHSVCRKKCGEVCTPCRERCRRKCEHQWCTKLCGETCTVPPCIEPCQKQLRCGHPCIGFCGDPCPPKCLVCDKEEILDPFFGTEAEDARYVLLIDCKHIVESSGMEQWLEQNEFQISYKLCPRCKAAIKSTQRYSDYVKMAIKDVAEVKMKANGSQAEIMQKRHEITAQAMTLRSKCSRLNPYCIQVGQMVDSIQMRVQKNKGGRWPQINISEAQSLKSKLQIIESVVDICCNENVALCTSREIFFPQILFIMDALSRDPDFITSQEIDDINCEIDRLSRIVDFSCLKNSPQFQYHSTSDGVSKHLIAIIEKHVFDCKQFTKENNEFLKEHLKELNIAMKSGIAISDREKKEILQAMGFSKGHWFKCPNGHVYAIGECGGAMEEAKCNECGARIGGRNHSLLMDNAVATEMDGAQFGAWSARANMLDYELLH